MITLKNLLDICKEGCTMKKIIVWFRRDLRLHDHEALFNAAEQGLILPVFIWPNNSERHEHTKSTASNWWLHHSLLSLKQELAKYDIPLIIRKGSIESELKKLIHEVKADAVFYNECADPMFQPKANINELLLSLNVEVATFNDNLLYPSGHILNKQHQPYKIFTSYWKRAIHEIVAHPLPVPKLKPIKCNINSVMIKELHLLTFTNWHHKFNDIWEPGEQNAIKRWHYFLENILEEYNHGRDYPSASATARISPYLAWGNISIKAIWHSLYNNIGNENRLNSSMDEFARQLIWRDFAYDQLIHFPDLIKKPLRRNFDSFPWIDDEDAFQLWTRGKTGYPLVDAGMRELWNTGYIHNRVRMIVASFLVKHLLIPWTKGSNWLENTLVDYDVANNALGWQWTTGCGIDAAPYFRIFNPIAQGQRFDPDGSYVRKWVPELKNLPNKYIHCPWKAPNQILANAAVELGKNYPFPIVDHNAARKRALDAYNQIKGKA